MSLDVTNSHFDCTDDSLPNSTVHAATNDQVIPEIKINSYDLLPPSHLASFLWLLGASVLHSGVVVDDKEYAFGGHNNQGVTGVYWTKPRLLPPGGTFKCELSMGVPRHSRDEIDQIIRQTSQEFLGPSWSLLTNNCNHFTSTLCQRLTSQTPPSWLNRAATIGIALPCLVPKQWLSPPNAETAEGALVEGSPDDETAALLTRGAPQVSTVDDGPDYDYASQSEPEEGSETDSVLDMHKRRRRRIYRTSGKPKIDQLVPVTNG